MLQLEEDLDILGTMALLELQRKKVESNSATSFLSDLREVITSVGSSLKMGFWGIVLNMK